MSGEQLYKGLCSASNLDAAVSRLTREELATVAEHLSGLKPTGGVPAQVFGMVSAKLSPERVINRAPRKRKQPISASLSLAPNPKGEPAR